MRVLLFGATGMVGQGVLRACLADNAVTEAVCINRSPLDAGIRALPGADKLRQVLHADFFDYASITPQLTGFDACFFTLGVSAFRMDPAEYRRLTFDLTRAAAITLARLNPEMTFIYVSGTGTSATSRQKWARVRGETENMLLALPFRAAYMFRPGFIAPMDGIRSKTRFYQFFYDVLAPVTPLMVRWLPGYANTTRQVGEAMLYVARHGWRTKVLETRDIGVAAQKAE